MGHLIARPKRACASKKNLVGLEANGMTDVHSQVRAATQAFSEGAKVDVLELQDAYFETGVDPSRLKDNAWPGVVLHASHAMDRVASAVNILPQKGTPLDPWGDEGVTALEEGREYTDPFTGETFITLHPPMPDPEKEHPASSDLRLEKAHGRLPERPKREVFLKHPTFANASIEHLDYVDERLRGEVVASADVYTNRAHLVASTDFDSARDPNLYDGENIRPSNEQRARPLIDTNRGRFFKAPEKTLRNRENEKRPIDPGVQVRRRLNGASARRPNPVAHVETRVHDGKIVLREASVRARSTTYVRVPDSETVGPVKHAKVRLASDASQLERLAGIEALADVAIDAKVMAPRHVESRTFAHTEQPSLNAGGRSRDAKARLNDKRQNPAVRAGPTPVPIGNVERQIVTQRDERVAKGREGLAEAFGSAFRETQIATSADSAANKRKGPVESAVDGAAERAALGSVRAQAGKTKSDRLELTKPGAARTGVLFRTQDELSHTERRADSTSNPRTVAGALEVGGSVAAHVASRGDSRTNEKIVY